jgi:nucleotidyltransferase/DNA polymerase involved in DNA repair
MSRTILHVDLDAFYAAVEVRENPALRGRPVVVGADPRGGRGRGVVCAASYEARRYGIHSAMPISIAYRRCPSAVYLRPRMSLYAEVSARFMKILERYTDCVEPLSIDEAFLDVTGSRSLFGDGETIARRIKGNVRDEERITASIGAAPTKFVAKIASDLRKPDGMVLVAPDRVTEFLNPLPVGRLWGAGAKTIQGFQQLGLNTIGDVAAAPFETLRRAFGESTAHHFHRLARGIDPREVEPERRAQSIGHETTFADDVHDRCVVQDTLLELVEQVAHRLRARGRRGRTITVKLRTADFKTVTRRASLPRPVDVTEAMWPVVKNLLHNADRTDQAIRLVGVSVSDFGEAEQLGLFEHGAIERQRSIARALDALTDRFGRHAVKRGGLLRRR